MTDHKKVRKAMAEYWGNELTDEQYIQYVKKHNEYSDLFGKLFGYSPRKIENIKRVK